MRTKLTAKIEPQTRTHPCAKNQKKTVFSQIIPLSTGSLSGWVHLKASKASRSTTFSGRCWRTRLDAKQRKLIWPDTERLDLDQSVRRIEKEYPNLPRDQIEEHLLYWIEMDYAPEDYSKAQLDELDRLTERWVADHLRQTKTSKKGKRTRHS